VDFFIEDIGQDALYAVILLKLLPNIKFDNIYPLGGKKNMIEHVKNNKNRRKSVYIVDKDFDDLLRKKYRRRNFFYLERYCIENYLIEDDAFIKFIRSEKPSLKITDIGKKLTFNIYCDYLVKNLRTLFCTYLLVQMQKLDKIENCKIPPEYFALNHDKSMVNEQKVQEYLENVRNTYKINLESEFDNYQKDFELKKKNDLKGYNISGKYLLSFISHKIRKEFRCSQQPMISFVYRISEYCNFESLKFLRIKINRYLNN
jgi:hypothetical protein